MNRHNQDKIRRKDIKKVKGKTYLGIDAGSTTTKATLIDEDRTFFILFTGVMKEIR